ncbi:MAG: HD domain-containing protein [Planctomycetota bacterium]
MSDQHFRTKIAFEAARLLHQGQESDYPRAKRRAARSIGLRFRPDHLPSNREVRDQLRRIEEVVSQESKVANPRRVLLEVYRLARRFKEFSPRAYFENDPNELPRQACLCLTTPEDTDISTRLQADRLVFRREDMPRPDFASRGLFVSSTLPVQVYCRTHSHDDIASMGLPHHAIPRTLQMLESEIMPGGYTDTIEDEIEGIDPEVDRFEVYRMLLESLEEIQLDRRTHPEGDALYHSLQVFELAVQEVPFDEDFLAAALLHDVGKGANPDDHVAEGISLLSGVTTYRTRWLIAHLEDAKLFQRRELPADVRRELEMSEDFEDLLRLADFDRQGRQPGVPCRNLEEAIDYLRELSGQDYG